MKRSLINIRGDMGEQGQIFRQEVWIDLGPEIFLVFST
jgi:hypothetical protein